MKSNRIAGCFCLIVSLFASIASACDDHEVTILALDDMIVCVGSTVAVEVSAYCTPPQGTCSIVLYDWSASGGIPNYQMGESNKFSCSYSNPNTYEIQVKAVCAGGYSNRAIAQVTVVQMVSLQSSKEVVGVGENVMFTVVMNPTNHYNTQVD